MIVLAAIFSFFWGGHQMAIEKFHDLPRLGGTTISLANNYYLDSEAGNDNNDGKTPQTPWKTLTKISSVYLHPGDSVLFKRGNLFQGVLEISGQATSTARITIDAYGHGKKPAIEAPDHSPYAIRIKNSNYITLQNFDVSNKGSQRMAYRTGVKVLCEEYGTSRNIILNALDIHDVNGSLIKRQGGGSGILIENRWKSVESNFDSLLIENCTIRRCERNAMIWSAPWSRKKWFPSTNTIVRKNLIEEVPGDGIVPIGCDGALVEYNLMRKGTDLLAIDEAAAGIWPWSCDNTIIQFNEVSDHKAPWDGQGFDSDFNCNNTMIRYNYSHDNEGGFILICNAGKEDTTESVGNRGTVVQYNISVNDAIRTETTHTGKYFSPTIHIGGPCKETRINNNILHVTAKPGKNVERCIIASESWDGYADQTNITSNVFFTSEPSSIRLTKSTNNTFSGNFYLGEIQPELNDKQAKIKNEKYEKLMQENVSPYKVVEPLLNTVSIGDGAAEVKVVNVSKAEKFFNNSIKR